MSIGLSCKCNHNFFLLCVELLFVVSVNNSGLLPICCQNSNHVLQYNLSIYTSYGRQHRYQINTIANTY